MTLSSQDQKVSIKPGELHRWYRKAAEAGNASAMNNLGYAYEHGEGVAEDQAEAVRWYRMAASADVGSAGWNLAVGYDEGDFGARNHSEAGRYLIEAALLGHEKALDAVRGGMTNWARETRQAVQRFLAEKGHYSGRIDGDFGPRSRRAVEDLLSE